MSIEWAPLPYMKQAVRFMLSHACAGLLLSPGGRKTSITLATLKILFEKKMIRKVLIIAPRRPCYSVWPGEIEKWAQFNDLTFEILHGPKKDAALQREAQIYLINPEGLDWLLQSEKTKYQSASMSKFAKGGEMVTRTRVDVNVAAFKKLGFDTLVIDEIHQFKNQGSQRFKMMKKIIGTFARRYGLTGSPAANGLLDLFGQCYMLDMGNALGQFITHFRAKYFDADHMEVSWTLKPGAEEMIYEQIAPLMLRIDTDSLQDLPEQIIVDIKLDMPTQARKVYDELEGDLISQIDGHDVVAANSGSASMKCRQVCQGGIYHTDAPVPGEKKGPRTWSSVHKEKVEALRGLYDELQGSPLLIAYEFDFDVMHLREEFKAEIAMGKFVIAADVKAGDFRELERRWNAGEIAGLAGHPRAIGVGLNLQESGCNVCWYAPTWDYLFFDQLNRRVRRSGNKAVRVFIHRFIMRNTLEEYLMVPELGRKEAGQDALFSALMRLREARR